MKIDPNVFMHASSPSPPPPLNSGVWLLILEKSTHAKRSERSKRSSRKVLGLNFEVPAASFTSKFLKNI